MSKARLVITAIEIEGRRRRRGDRGLRRLTVVDLRAPRPLPRRGRRRLRATITTPPHQPDRDPQATIDLIIRAPQTADRVRPRRRPRHHRLAPAAPPPGHSLDQHHRPDPDPPEPGRTAAEEATEVLLHPLRSRATQRDLAVRLHPLPPRRRHAHRPTPRSSPGSTTTPATPCTSPPTPASPAGSWSTPSPKPQPNTAIPPRCSPTTAWSTRPGSPAAAAAATAWSPSCNASTSSRRTPAPTTRPPAARSSGSSRR